MRYLSFIYYAFEVIMVNEFSGLTLLFNADGFAGLIISGSAILDNYNLNEADIGADIAILASLIVALQIIATLALKLKPV